MRARRSAIAPDFTPFLHPARHNPGSLRRSALDIVYLIITAAFLAITLALVKGCSALERRK
jgi:hypothetical protein